MGTYVNSPPRPRLRMSKGQSKLIYPYLHTMDHYLCVKFTSTKCDKHGSEKTYLAKSGNHIDYPRINKLLLQLLVYCNILLEVLSHSCTSQKAYCDARAPKGRKESIKVQSEAHSLGTPPLPIPLCDKSKVASPSRT